LKAEIDTAIANTAHLPHYFWTGLLPPFSGRADSVEPRARDAARRLGGTTLEDTLVGINMPTWAEQDQDSQDTWTYASEAYANAAQGVTYVFRGEQVRPTNVFDNLEFPRLVANPSVTGIYQINIHLADEDQPMLIWPDQTPATAETLLVSSITLILQFTEPYLCAGIQRCRIMLHLFPRWSLAPSTHRHNHQLRHLDALRILLWRPKLYSQPRSVHLFHFTAGCFFEPYTSVNG
ncbi:hypothetical protein B0H19DRAFT_952467, partial [Mycena capillaripes]